MSTLIESPAETVVQLRPSGLSAHAENDPTAVAVSAADCELTYRELDLWSNRLARLLLARGAGPGVRIAVAVTPAVEATVTNWAIAKTGAVAVPAAPGTPVPGAALGVTTKALRRELADSLGWLVLDDRSTLVHYMTGSDAPITDADRGSALKIA
ncbi:AMP-binding protein [Nocardia sp. GCM10030253]|uniref:AMP-binding protein n=1 Tax=Nocardia sp. GCM10030253 TaxID=3273404 RepID=UPI003644FD72